MFFRERVENLTDDDVYRIWSVVPFVRYFTRAGKPSPFIKTENGERVPLPVSDVRTGYMA